MKGKTVVMTGGTSGIGEVAAEKLAQMGARVVLVARDTSRGEGTLARLSLEFDTQQKCRELLSGSRGDSVLCNRAKLLRLRLHRRHLRLCEFGLQREDLVPSGGWSRCLRRPRYN